DNLGNKGKTEAGNVQVMSAGTGIFHSEHNLENVDTNLYQIWIEPNEEGVKPRWEAREFPKKVGSGLSLLASGLPEHQKSGAIFMHADAAIYGGVLKKGASLKQELGDKAYLLVSTGSIELDGKTLTKGDGAEISDVKNLSLKANEESELVLATRNAMATGSLQPFADAHYWEGGLKDGWLVQAPVNIVNGNSVNGLVAIFDKDTYYQEPAAEALQPKPELKASLDREAGGEQAPNMNNGNYPNLSLVTSKLVITVNDSNGQDKRLQGAELQEYLKTDEGKRRLAEMVDYKLNGLESQQKEMDKQSGVGSWIARKLGFVPGEDERRMELSRELLITRAAKAEMAKLSSDQAKFNTERAGRAAAVDLAGKSPETQFTGSFVDGSTVTGGSPKGSMPVGEKVR
ncbi:MAG: hypothetical protein EBV03_03615, partial [Proteobacteria bacterium]|nr:hypothetical protein [Pseudomonadota bacterium]